MRKTLYCYLILIFGCIYQRYFKNEKYARQDGPIFIYLGGEWTISKGVLLESHMRDMAVDLSGLLIYTEHRYYGKTQPTK